MKKVLFTDNWTVRRADEQNYIPVLIPHDAMITEPRSDKAAAGVNNGWIVCGNYVYCKHFDSDELGGKPCAVLEFEGVYKDAVVTLNGKEVAVRRKVKIRCSTVCSTSLRKGAGGKICDSTD